MSGNEIDREVTDEEPGEFGERGGADGASDDALNFDGRREAALRNAKAGYWGGLFFAGMTALGLTLTLLLDQNPSTGEEIADEDRLSSAIGIGAELALILFFSWRVKTGRGLVSSLLLLILFGIEIGAKIYFGTTSAGWFIFYLAIAFLLCRGVLGTWQYRRVETEIERSLPERERQKAAALRSARLGSVGGLLFSGMILLGLIYVLAAGPNIPSGVQVPPEKIYSIIGFGAVLLIALFLTWRVGTGRGFISSLILMPWFLFEVGVNIYSQELDSYWYAIYSGIAFLLYKGISGTWRYRRLIREEPPGGAL